ncbi:hypothetical protein ACFOKI_07005 [Sphingomonas qilianensis]|uniref:Tetratricopeptide repeat protein n=1 Tax=Sphingomonas qilianensis TaxID=1736690 RepID=A0ABU9XQR2_9SPHN
MRQAWLIAGTALTLPLAGLGMVAAADTRATPPVAAPPARLPGYAATLAQQRVTGPSAWRALPESDAWAALSRAAPGDRQRARWDYARSLVAKARGAEAQGVLTVMQLDDPDLAMVPAFRLARGAAFVLSASPAEALDLLGDPALAANSEGCAWRLRALAGAGYAAQALRELHCALPAVNARHGAARLPFVLAAARATVDSGAPTNALQWLKGVAGKNAEATILQARALIALGRHREAMLMLDRTPAGGSEASRMEARLIGIELGLATRALRPATALKQLADLRFGWRGDQIEERALRLSHRLSHEARDARGALATGAVLFRFFDPGAQGPGFAAALQSDLAAVLDDDTLPLDQAAGAFWDYRDLMPSGSEGDRLVSRLGRRLEAAGLYERAADLFEHLLFVRAEDLARGPLSVQVATLHVLAGHPDRALAALRRTAQPGYTNEMIYARKRVEAAALSQIGQIPASLAVLQEVPDAAALRSEILWKKRDWSGLVTQTAAIVPPRRSLSDIDQVVLLRHAIALAMLGREDALAQFHARYAMRFAPLPTAAAFDVLTASPNSVDPEAIARAMASLPAASPAGDLAVLFEAEKK